MIELNLVYLVDDNDITLFISLKAIELTKSVKQVKCFKNAEEALEELCADTKNLPELILLDLNMPVMDGWEFIQRFDCLKPAIKNTVKLCVLTSSLNSKDKEFFKNHHAALEYIVKPITAKKFTSVLNNIKAT